MTKTKNADLQKVFDVITNFVEGQLSKLPPEVAAAKRKQVRQILSSATRGIQTTPCLDPAHTLAPVSAAAIPITSPAGSPP